MRVGLYLAVTNPTIGGGESMIAVIAQALAARHQVDIVDHRETTTLDRLTQFSGLELPGVRVRRVEQPHGSPWGESRFPWRRRREERAWGMYLSAEYDVFINLAHTVPPFCHAPVGVLCVLFPWFARTRISPGSTDPWCTPQLDRSSRLEGWLRRRYYDWTWRERMASYQVKLAISGYAREWSRRWWGIDPQVVYPPVNLSFRAVEKTNAILSVARLSEPKKQAEMLHAFRDLATRGAGGWEFWCAGWLGELPEDRQYFERLQEGAAGRPVRLAVGPPRDAIKRLYEEARIFWHATGCGEDLEEFPQRAEHFGIATVEAMAAGCVPVVINAGGQKEIVEHGVSGFLWNDLDELRSYTLELMGDEKLLRRMSDAARTRARRFGSERFLDAVRNTLRPFGV